MQPATRTSRAGPVTILTLLIGVALGVALIALIGHSIRAVQQQASGTPAPSARAILGLVIDPNLAVVSVDSGRAADRAGIRPGDTLSAFNGIGLTDASTARQTLVRAVQDKAAVTVGIVRDGQTLRLVAHISDSAGPIRIGGVVVTPTPATGDYWYL